MISTYSHQKELHQERLQLKTTEMQLTNSIQEGTNCSRFESQVVARIAKECFMFGEYSDKRSLTAGQLVYNAACETEPAGKNIAEIKTVRVILTLLESSEDPECEKAYGAAERRRQQITRISMEAKDQGGLLTQEDLGKILGTDSRTIRRDIKTIREGGIEVPTRGQQMDIGPRVTHREKAVRMFIEGKEPVEIARDIKHSLHAVERYISTYCRVVFCQRQLRNTLNTAKVIGISVSGVNNFLGIHEEFLKKAEYKPILIAIEEKGSAYWDACDFKKKRGQKRERRVT